MPDYDAKREQKTDAASDKQAGAESQHETKGAADKASAKSDGASAKGQSAELMKVFPHAGAIERGTGQPIVGKAYFAPEATKERGVEAYTDGDEVHFGKRAPTLRVAAHEATHLLQNRRVTFDAKLGAEKHAEAVADAIVAGRSAKELISTKVGSPVDRGLHPYTRYTVDNQKKNASNDWGAGNAAAHDMLVADDGALAMYDNGYGSQKVVYAHAPLITTGENTLKAQKSAVEMSKGANTVQGKAPVGNAAQTLYEVVFKDRDTPAQALELGYPGAQGGDCGLTMNQVTGGHRINNQQSAVMRDPGGDQTYTAYRGYYGNQAGKNTAQDMLADIMQAEYGAEANLKGKTTRQIQEDHAAKGTDTMAQKRGLDEYAIPDVGQGMVTMADTEATGHAYANQGQKWNFHFGTNILRSGSDWAALENYTGHGAANWFVYLYGPANKAQTWHHRNAGSGEFGNIAKTMVTEPGNMHFGKATKDVELYVATDWAKTEGKLAANDTYRVEKRSAASRQITVLSGVLMNKVGFIKEADFEGF